MIQPRNSLVVVKLIEQAEKRVGAITVPTNKDCFCEAEVIAVGPGIIQATGGRHENFDLKVGQRVFIKHKSQVRGPMGITAELVGIEYRDGNEKFYIFEQGNILGIVAEPA
jgi:co-chaperonin GroES (HSP10)